MDFFDDPNLFVGGLEGLDEEGFPPGPSLVDELNLSAGFEPLQVESLGLGKNPGMMPPVSTPSQQAMQAYGQQMGHYAAIKTQNAAGQPFPGSGATGDGGGGMMAQQHGQYHSTNMSQAPQANGLFCSNSSPMWGNQDQNGNMYQPLSQQQQQQQLHNQQLHLRQQQTQQQQHHPGHQQQQRMQQLQQQNHHQQLLNQHQQMNPQALPQQQQHHNFNFHQESHSQSRQQVHHSQPSVQHQLTIGGARFHSRPMANSGPHPNASIDGAPLQQQQSGYQLARGGQAFSGSGPEDASLSFSIQSASMAHTMPTCPVSSDTAYPPSQYPTYPGESDMPSFSQQSLPPASVSMPTSSAPLTSTVPELSGAECEFSSSAAMVQQQPQVPVSQVEQCPFRAMQCPGQMQGNYNSSEMFGQAMSCYPSVASQLPSEQPQNCESAGTPATTTTTSNGYQALEERLLPSEAQAGGFEGLQAPDLLADELLPQLEAALGQQDESNCSWTNGSQEEGEDYKQSPPVDYEEQVTPPHI